MLEITDNEIKTRLAFDNPWWVTGQVDERFRKMPQRAYFDGFLRLVTQTSVNRAVVLMGPRRVGKTVMITQTVQALIGNGVAPNTIFYVSVDTPTYTALPLEKLLSLFLEIFRHEPGTPLYVLFDEIQYHPDWERHLKVLVDTHPAVRFVASGSAAAALKMKSVESGAGRFTDFLLPPLNFAEYIEFSNTSMDLVDFAREDYDVSALNDAFLNYINFGGFPETVFKTDMRPAMDRFVASDIVDKVLLRDLPSLYGIQDTQELKRFFMVIAYNSGMEVSYEGLSNASGVAKNTIRKYLDYLEAAFLIFRLQRINQSGKRFKRVTHFKVYLTNPSIRAALFGPLESDNEAMGHIVETAYLAHIAASIVSGSYFYARWQRGEVDLVSLRRSDGSVEYATEIKWSDRPIDYPHKELRSLIEFTKRTRSHSASAYIKSQFGRLKTDGVEIYLIPLSIATYLHAIHFTETPNSDMRIVDVLPQFERRYS